MSKPRPCGDPLPPRTGRRRTSRSLWFCACSTDTHGKGGPSHLKGRSGGGVTARCWGAALARSETYQAPGTVLTLCHPPPHHSGDQEPGGRSWQPPSRGLGQAAMGTLSGPSRGREAGFARKVFEEVQGKKKKKKTLKMRGEEKACLDPAGLSTPLSWELNPRNCTPTATDRGRPLGRGPRGRGDPGAVALPVPERPASPAEGMGFSGQSPGWGAGDWGFAASSAFARHSPGQVPAPSLPWASWAPASEPPAALAQRKAPALLQD